MRKFIVAANWKMNMLPSDCKNYVNELNNLLEKDLNQDLNLVVCPPFTHIESMVSATSSHQKVQVGGQDCATQASGAFTGDVAATMLADLNANYCIIGHSERRMYHNDDDGIIEEKLTQVIASKLIPIFCIGESLKERKEGIAKEVVERQILNVISNFIGNDLLGMVIAYEPIWAIGTGLVPENHEIQEMHAHIRSVVTEEFDEEIAESISIVYGGSVKPNNAKEIFALDDVDGGLIGGASLKPTDFAAIIKASPSY